MSEAATALLLERLRDRLESDEGLELEYKAAYEALPKDLWPTLSAFANTSGGWIVLGVAEHKDSLTVHGVANPSYLLQNLYNGIRDKGKISHSVCGADDTTSEYVGDKQVVVIRVSAAARKDRPVYINGNPYEGTYVRRHSGDYHCTKPEVDRMMREASSNAADSTILLRFTWDDLDRDTFARYRRRYLTANPGSPLNNYDDQELLRALKGFRRDRESGAEGITVAGLLMFGRPEAIREWRTRHLIDYRLLPSEVETDIRWDDRVVFEGNLLNAFESIYPRLTAGQPVPFRLEAGTRIDEGPVQLALREALVNLLAHADYGETQASVIIRSPAGYCFRNPGNSRVQENDLWASDRSDPRNPELVHMFRLIGLAEEAGTGIPRIISAWRELGFRLPRIDVGTERYEFSIELRHAHLFSDEDRDWLHALSQPWTEAESLALIFARHEDEVDNPTLRRLTGHHAADITKVLGSLRDRGFLQMLGGGRGARYQLGPAASGVRTGIERSGQGLLPLDAGMTAVTDSQHNDLDSLGSDPNSQRNDPNSQHSDLSSVTPIEDPTVVWTELLEIARPVREQGRSNPQERDAVIVRLCERSPLTLSQIAQLMDRHKERVRLALQPLVTAGRIAHLYPYPSHPRQKYRATTSSPEDEVT
jgi:ATP-dependent DNA helicase RecG